MWKIVIILLLNFLALTLVWGKLPADVKKCTPTDKKCIIENINHIFETKFNGDPELGLLTFDPSDLDDLVLQKDANNPINIETTMTNLKLYGMKNMRATKLKGFGPQLEGVHEILFKTPVFTLLGDYKLNGKILVLPVTGEGKLNITFVESFTKLTFEGKPLNKDGQVYFEVSSLKLDGSQKRVIFHFDNLFNGDKVLGDQFNAFINQEWEVLQNEFFRPIVDLFQKSAVTATKRVFSTTPYNEIFNIAE